MVYSHSARVGRPTKVILKDYTIPTRIILIEFDSQSLDVTLFYITKCPDFMVNMRSALTFKAMISCMGVIRNISASYRRRGKLSTRADLTSTPLQHDLPS